MALFGRKSENNEVPEDLQQYYNTGGTGILKWVIRVVGGLVVLALLVWGGIWLFHKLSSKNTSGTAQTNTSKQQPTQQQTEQQKKAADAAKKAQADAKKAEQEAQQKAGDAAKKEQAAQQAAPSPQPQTAANGSSTGSTPAQTQSGSTDSNLVNTGPGESLAAVFVSTSALGAAAHALITRARKRQLR